MVLEYNGRNTRKNRETGGGLQSSEKFDKRDGLKGHTLSHKLCLIRAVTLWRFGLN